MTATMQNILVRLYPNIKNRVVWNRVAIQVHFPAPPKVSVRVKGRIGYRASLWLQNLACWQRIPTEIIYNGELLCRAEVHFNWARFDQKGHDDLEAQAEFMGTITDSVRPTAVLRIRHAHQQLST